MILQSLNSPVHVAKAVFVLCSEDLLSEKQIRQNIVCFQNDQEYKLNGKTCKLEIPISALSPESISESVFWRIKNSTKLKIGFSLKNDLIGLKGQVEELGLFSNNKVSIFGVSNVQPSLDSIRRMSLALIHVDNVYFH